MEVKQLQFGEIPEGVDEFWLIRKDFVGEIILEHYKKAHKKEWNSEEVHSFYKWTPFDREGVLKEAETFLKKNSTLYVEEETFWDEIN